MAGDDVRFAAGVPNVGPFGDPLLLTDLAVAAEDSGWDAFSPRLAPGNFVSFAKEQ